MKNSFCSVIVHVSIFKIKESGTPKISKDNCHNWMVKKWPNIEKRFSGYFCFFFIFFRGHYSAKIKLYFSFKLFKDFFGKTQTNEILYSNNSLFM